MEAWAKRIQSDLLTLEAPRNVLVLTATDEEATNAAVALNTVRLSDEIIPITKEDAKLGRSRTLVASRHDVLDFVTNEQPLAWSKYHLVILHDITGREYDDYKCLSAHCLLGRPLTIRKDGTVYASVQFGSTSKSHMYQRLLNLLVHDEEPLMTYYPTDFSHSKSRSFLPPYLVKYMNERGNFRSQILSTEESEITQISYYDRPLLRRFIGTAFGSSTAAKRAAEIQLIMKMEQANLVNNFSVNLFRLL